MYGETGTSEGLWDRLGKQMDTDIPTPFEGKLGSIFSAEGAHTSV